MTVTTVAATTAPPSPTQVTAPTPQTPGQQTHVFYFFSPRCPYCARQTPLLNTVVQGRHDVVGIAMDTTREELLAHIQHMHVRFPVTLDQGESQTFGVTGYPTVVVLDAAGRATRLQGLLTRGELERVLGGGV
jgi:protein-disulfide isomerase